MIVASLVSRNPEDLARACEEARNLGAEVVEVRADLLHDPDPAMARAAVTSPAVYTLRSASEGGRWTGDGSERKELLTRAADGGFDFVDVELSSGIDPADIDKPCILSYHDLESVPADLDATLRKMVDMAPFAAKAVCNASTLEEELRLVEMQKRFGSPAVIFGMGPFALVSRVLGPKFGAPAVYASLKPGSEAAPGQPDLKTLLGTYRVDRIGPETEVFGLAGHPLGHSLSPARHNERFARQGRNAVYLPFDTEDFDSLWNRRELLDLRGLSVTLPHKVAALRAARSARSPAPSAGCANTLTLEGGNWVADNTDVRALSASFTESGVSLSGKRVLVLGTGGAARAACDAVKSAGGRPTVAGRSEEKAKELAETFDAPFAPLAGIDPGPFDVIINATPLGMVPHAEKTPIDPSLLSPNQTVFDAVYNPEETALLEGARARGCQTIPGTAMFRLQAEAQQRLWADC
jgi:3-dehydroquinate dehydratase/shikimate dehydrogenase